jgi:hypothetical protein
VVNTTSKAWDFPYCARCVEDVRTSAKAGVVAKGVLLAGFILAIGVGVKMPMISSVVILLGGIAASIAVYIKMKAKAKDICVPGCASVRIVVAYSGWQGTRHTFDIDSDSYASKFMIANQSKLVNVAPETWEWLKGNGYVALPNQSQSARRNMS